MNARRIGMLMLTITTSWLADEAKAQQAEPPTRLPPVVVEEKPPIKEETLVGPYNQPAWTTTQYRAPSVPVYVLPPWRVELNQWWTGEWPKHGAPTNEFQEEAEIGLPHRFQVDAYEVWGHADGSTQQTGEKIELRYALADWGKIPLNPTLYAEWKFNQHEADAYEAKLLLGQELAPRWHWGFNAIFEQQVGGPRTKEFALSQAVTYTLLDDKLDLGVEMKLESETESGARGPAPIEFDIGPTIQWKPTRHTRLSVAPLLGVTHDSPRAEIVAVFAIDWGAGYENERGAVPHAVGK